MTDTEYITMLKDLTKSLCIFIGSGTYSKSRETAYHLRLRDVLEELLGRDVTTQEIRQCDSTWDGGACERHLRGMVEVDEK